MKKAVTVIIVLLIVIYLAALAIPINPDEQRPGTRLSGTVVDSPASWDFLEDRQQLYVQTSTWYGIPHSVTTTSIVSDGTLYVPCGWCPGKRWPKNVAADPDVLVKAGDNLYPLVAERVTDMQEKMRVLSAIDHDRLPDIALYKMKSR